MRTFVVRYWCVLFVAGWSVLLLASCGRRDEERAVPAAAEVVVLADRPDGDRIEDGFDDWLTDLPEVRVADERVDVGADDAVRLVAAVGPVEAVVVLTHGGELVSRTHVSPGVEVDFGEFAGDVEVLISADGFEPLRRLVRRGEMRAPLYFELRAVSGMLRVKGNASALVRVLDEAGEVVHEGMTSVYGVHEAHLPEGRYEVEVSKANHVGGSRRVEIREGAPLHVEMVLDGLPGTLWIASSRRCEVRLGDELAGETDAAISNIPPGRHLVVLSRAGFRSAQMAIEVGPGEFVTLVAPVLTPETGAVLVTLASAMEEDDYFEGLEKEVALSSGEFQRGAGPFLFEGAGGGRLGVVAEAEGYRMQGGPARVEAEDGKTNRVHVVMVPLDAKVRVEVWPDDALLHDGAGAVIGRAGDVLEMASFSPHVIRVAREGYGEQMVRLPGLRPLAETNVLVRLSRVRRVGELVISESPEIPSLSGLAAGSMAALERQIAEAGRLGMPLEARAGKSGIVLRFIPAGGYFAGSPAGERGRQPDEAVTEFDEAGRLSGERASIPSGFYMSAHEVTWRQWRRVMGSGPAGEVHPDAPVERVSWNDCQVFLEDLCELEGVAPGTYRLPTELEWEYACRAGTQAAIYRDVDWDDAVWAREELRRLAWFRDNSAGVDGEEVAGRRRGRDRGGPGVAGRKQPNAWGLHDMLGNVWEWCDDLYAPDYAGARLPDAGADVPRTATRVARGGGWSSGDEQCRAAQRFPNGPSYKDRALGFRVVRDLPMPGN